MVDSADFADVSKLCQSLANRLHKAFVVVPSIVRKGHYRWVEAKLAQGATPLATFHAASAK